MDLLAMAIAVIVVLAILLFAEWGWRKHWLNGEIGRKFVHITVGTFVAFWPFFMGWTEIRILSLSFFIVVLVAMKLKLFHSLGSVQRPTYGELFFALSVGALTIITNVDSIYAVAILMMALADGFAAIVGTYWGRENKYHLFSRTKSWAGTATFFFISLALLIGYSLFSNAGLAWEYVLAATLGATLIENLAALGFDNLLVPIGVGMLLTLVY